jgi:hypothetical protein
MSTKRIQKRFQRENRKNKGAGTEAKRQTYNAKVRKAREHLCAGSDADALSLYSVLYGK